jgi:hypothetical protein
VAPAVQVPAIEQFLGSGPRTLADAATGGQTQE